MKGVESVIAIILILMIVIALAALAYTWFTGIFSSLTSTAGTAVTTTTTSMATQFRLESARCDANPCTSAAGGDVTFIVRNIGEQNFDPRQTAFYVGGTPLTGMSAPTCSPTGCAAVGNPLVEGNIATYTKAVAVTDSVTCGSSVIKATIASGITDSKVIIC